MTRLLPLMLSLLPFLHANSSKDGDCRRPAYLPRLPQRLQGEVMEIWTDPEPETTLTYADEPVIFKPSCEWRMSRTRMLLSKLSRVEYYRVFPRRGPAPPRTTARVVTLPPARAPSRPATPPPPPRRYSTAARRGSARTRQQAGACRPPAAVARLPHAVQARIAAIWHRQRPHMTCAEMHRKTKQIMVNLPLRFRSAFGRSSPRATRPKPAATTTTTTTRSPVPPPSPSTAPQLDCKLPHFLARLEPALQEKLRRIWAGFVDGQDCAERVAQQLAILKANDISVESFRMPFPSLYADDLQTTSASKQRRDSRNA